MKKLKFWYVFHLAAFAVACWIMYNAKGLSPEHPLDYSIPGLLVALLSILGAGLTWHEMKRRKK